MASLPFTRVDAGRRQLGRRGGIPEVRYGKSGRKFLRLHGENAEVEELNAPVVGGVGLARECEGRRV